MFAKKLRRAAANFPGEKNVFLLEQSWNRRAVKMVRLWTPFLNSARDSFLGGGRLWNFECGTMTAKSGTTTRKNETKRPKSETNYYNENERSPLPFPCFSPRFVLLIFRNQKQLA
jgi:hypothetical protein